MCRDKYFQKKRWVEENLSSKTCDNLYRFYKPDDTGLWVVEYLGPEVLQIRRLNPGVARWWLKHNIKPCETKQIHGRWFVTLYQWREETTGSLILRFKISALSLSLFKTCAKWRPTYCIKNVFFWDVALCRSCVNRRSAGSTQILQPTVLVI
jgi:hypothetical protein